MVGFSVEQPGGNTPCHTTLGPDADGAAVCEGGNGRERGGGLAHVTPEDGSQLLPGEGEGGGEVGGVRPLHISHLIAPDHRVDVPCARFNILEKETGGGVGLPGKTVERGGQHPAAHGGVGRKGGVGGAGHDPAVRDLVHRHSVPSVGGDVIVDSSTDRKDQQRETKQKGQEAFHRQVSFLKKAAALRGGLSGTLERSRTSGLPLRSSPHGGFLSTNQVQKVQCFQGFSAFLLLSAHKVFIAKNSLF